MTLDTFMLIANTFWVLLAIFICSAICFINDEKKFNKYRDITIVLAAISIIIFFGIGILFSRYCKVNKVLYSKPIVVTEVVPTILGKEVTYELDNQLYKITPDDFVSVKTTTKNPYIEETINEWWFLSQKKKTIYIK